MRSAVVWLVTVASSSGAVAELTPLTAANVVHREDPVPGFVPYTPVAPARLLDTRPGGTTIDGISAGACSVSDDTNYPVPHPNSSNLNVERASSRRTP